MGRNGRKTGKRKKVDLEQRKEDGEKKSRKMEGE